MVAGVQAESLFEKRQGPGVTPDWRSAGAFAYRGGMPGLMEQVEQVLCERTWLRRGSTLLVGVSGGLDSMVLLDLLHRLAPVHGWRLVVAHFNHGWRGRESDQDASFVRRMARKRGLVWVGARTGLRRHGRDAVTSEMAAREERHRFLARVAGEHRARVILLAHHADDQVETLLLRLFRGTGAEGLAGIRADAPSPAGGRSRVVRPLLGLWRRELETYAREQGLTWREDATNASTEPTRNWLRHEILPRLRERLGAGVAGNILRTGQIVAAEAEWIGTQAAAWLQPEPGKPPFDALPLALQRRVIREQLGRLNLGAEFDLVEHLRRAPGVPRAVTGGQSIQRDPSGKLRRVRKSGLPVQDQLETRLATRGGGRKTFHGLKLTWRVVPGQQRPRPGETMAEAFDADLVGPEICMRHWRAGDHFEPIGLGGSAKLQDLFTNLKVPREERHRRVLATTAGGRIFWVEGLRIAEWARLTPETRRTLKWQWRR